MFRGRTALAAAPLSLLPAARHAFAPGSSGRSLSSYRFSQLARSAREGLGRRGPVRRPFSRSQCPPVSSATRAGPRPSSVRPADPARVVLPAGVERHVEHQQPRLHQVLSEHRPRVGALCLPLGLLPLLLPVSLPPRPRLHSDDTPQQSQNCKSSWGRGRAGGGGFSRGFRYWLCPFLALGPGVCFLASPSRGLHWE